MHRGIGGQKIPCTWTTAQLDELQQKAPSISRLSIDFTLEGGKWVSIIGQDT
jgi:hypothetical protein